MTFEASKIEDFRQVFEASQETIMSFEGCNFVELLQDRDNKTTFFTYSYWESEEALENYRNSSFFREVWGNTKKMFAAKPEAWSVERLSGVAGSKVTPDH